MTMGLASPRQASFRFFDLPPEIRNTIYEMMLPDGVDIAAPSSTEAYSLPLFRASSQLRRECSAVYFSTCTFYINLTVSGNYVKFLEWIYCLNKEDVSRIRTMRLKSTVKGSSALGCTNDRKVCFTIRRGMRYVFDCGFVKPYCRGPACQFSHHAENITNLPISRLGPFVIATQPGNLTASDVVGWVSAILHCASVHY